MPDTPSGWHREQARSHRVGLLYEKDKNMSDARVAGKVALIAGGASGVGRATALLLARARVVISDIDVAGGLALAEEIGAQALFIEHDAGNETHWTRVIDTVREHCGVPGYPVQQRRDPAQGRYRTDHLQ